MWRSLDSILWRYSRAYRRRKIKRSAVWQVLRRPIRTCDQALEQRLQRPAVLSRYQQDGLREKLAEEGLIYGCAVGTGFMRLNYQELEQFCEHCPVWGKCCVCGQEHGIEGVSHG